ncbi:MAG: hypothetical protein INF44_00355 [Thalassospira sp.]|nr:hypothetical protein [Thalassospira sp.]
MAMKHLSAFEKISFGSGTGQKARYSYESGAPDPKVEQGVWRWLADDILKATQKREVTPYSSYDLEAALKAYNRQSRSTDKPLISRKELPGQAGFFTVERLNLNGQYEPVKDTSGNSIVCDKKGRLIQQDSAGQYFVIDAESGGYIAPNDDKAIPLTLSSGTSRPILFSPQNKLIAKKARGPFDTHGDSIKIDTFQFLSGGQIINAIGDDVKKQRETNWNNQKIVIGVRAGAALKTTLTFGAGALITTAFALSGVGAFYAVGAGCVALASTVISYFHGRSDRLAKIDQAFGEMATIDGNYLRGKESDIGGKIINTNTLNEAELPKAANVTDTALQSYKAALDSYKELMPSGYTSSITDAELKDIIAQQAALIMPIPDPKEDPINDFAANSSNNTLYEFMAAKIAEHIATSVPPITSKDELDASLGKTPLGLDRNAYNGYITQQMNSFGKTR